MKTAMNSFTNTGRSRPGSASGFTLIELMVVVAVVAILVAIALPSYSEAVRKGKRGQAKSDLVELAQVMERFRTINGTYDTITSPTFTNPITQSPKTGDANYTVAITEQSATAFKLTATPVGGQTDDRCGILSVDQAGGKKHEKGDDSQCQFGDTGT